MKFYSLLALCLLILFGSQVQALTVINAKESNTPIHVRVFNDEQNYQNWALGRGIDSVTFSLLKSFAQADLTVPTKETPSTLVRKVNEILPKIQGGAERFRTLIPETAGRRLVDYQFQLKYKHLDPNGSLKETLIGYPLGVYLVITDHGSKVPLWAMQVPERSKYTFTATKKDNDVFDLQVTREDEPIGRR